MVHQTGKEIEAMSSPSEMYDAIERDYRKAKAEYDKAEFRLSVLRQVLIDAESKRNEAWRELTKAAQLIPDNSPLSRKLADEQFSRAIE